FSAFSTRTLQVNCPCSTIWIGRVAAGSAECRDIAQIKAREISIIEGDAATTTSAASVGTVSTLRTNYPGAAKGHDINPDAATAASPSTAARRQPSPAGHDLTIQGPPLAHDSNYTS